MSDPHALPSVQPFHAPAPERSPLPYAVPYGHRRSAEPRPPASIKVIGIAGSIVGGLGLAYHLLAIALFLTVSITASRRGPAYHAFEFGTAIAFGVAAVALLAGSIGCLIRAEWGRRLLVGWAVVYIVLLTAFATMEIAWVIPTFGAPRAIGPNQQFAVFAAYAATGISVGIHTILPGFILAFLRRPYVRAAFH